MVLAITDPAHPERPIMRAYSQWSCTFQYLLGKTVYPREWHPNRWAECAGGIHFFLTREEAQDFEL